MFPAWVNKYTGLEFKEHGRDRSGVDCWGLVRLFYDEQYDIDIPSLTEGYHSTTEHRNIGKLIESEQSAWWPIAKDNEREGDVVLLSIAGHPMHLGVVVEQGWMVHAERGVDSVLESYNKPRWNRRLLGFYRHDRLLDWDHTDIPWPKEMLIGAE